MMLRGGRRRVREAAIWIWLATVGVANITGDIYSVRRTNAIAESQMQNSEKLDRLNQSQAKQESRDELHDILGHVKSMKAIVKMQGEEIRNPAYYEDMTKFQCERALELSKSALAKLDHEDPEAKAMVRNIKILETLVAGWVERDKSRKSRARQLHDALDKAEAAIEGLLPFFLGFKRLPPFWPPESSDQIASRPNLI